MAKPGEHLIKKCLLCSKLYRQSRSDQRYCSNLCCVRAWRRTKERFYQKCIRCGSRYYRTASGQKYCSIVCQKAIEQKRKKVVGGPGKGWSLGSESVPRQTCEVCGEKFYAPPARIIKNQGKFCSVGCKGVFMARHPEYFPQVKNQRSKSGRRKDLNDRYFRSAWEANYARYLNFLIKNKKIIRWEYEVDVFEFPIKRGSRAYLPDFKVWITESTFEYHEVKGYMDQRSATKIKRMGKYHPEIKLLVVDSPIYKGIAASVSPLIQGWE
jgi:hypothetical protein